MEKGVGVDHEDNAKVCLEVSREFGHRVIEQACCLRNDQSFGDGYVHLNFDETVFFCNVVQCSSPDAQLGANIYINSRHQNQADFQD